MKIPISKIITPSRRPWPRKADACKPIEDMLPIIVCKKGRKYEVIDGYSRLEAVKRAGQDWIEATVME